MPDAQSIKVALLHWGVCGGFSLSGIMVFRVQSFQGLRSSGSWDDKEMIGNPCRDYLRTVLM